MKFSIHNISRYNCISHPQYTQYRRTYFRHLSKLDFSRNSDLLKYLSGSFFHDGSIKHIELHPQKNAISFMLWRENDREDLNEFRQKHGLKPIPKAKYAQKPIIYTCNFIGIKSLVVKGKLQYVLQMDIMDTEIGWDKRNNVFTLLFGFSQKYELLISFSSCKVVMQDKKLIASYTAGRRKTLPWCSSCRSKLVSRSDLMNYANYGRTKK